LHDPGLLFIFPAAQNFEERERWLHALDSCIRHLHQPVRHLELTLPKSRKGVTLDQRMAETESYYQLLHEQVQSMLQFLNTTEEASQIQQTARTMLEALRQCIDTMKDIQVCRLNICDAIATAFRALDVTLSLR